MKIKSSYTIFSILMMLLLSSCLPVSKETTCADNEAYDAEQRKCVPTIANGPNTVFIVNPIPVSSAYLTNLSAPAIPHSVSVSNQYNTPISIKWNLYSGATPTPVSLGSNYTLAPSTLANPGNYILEAGVYNENGTTLYDSKTWTITVEAIATPTLTNNSPSINVITYASNVTSAIHSLDINNPGGLSGQYRTLIDGVLFNGLQTFNSGTSTISSTLNPSTLGMGLHSVEVQLLKTGTQVEYDSFVWTLNVIEPDLPKIQLATSTPSLYNAISAINAVSFQNTTSGTASESGYRDINNNAINKFCIVVDDSDKDNDSVSDLHLIFEINGAQQGGIGVFTQGGPVTTTNPNNNTYCHESFNPQNLINADISESRTLLIKSINVATGSVIETVQYDLKVRPKNLRPLISIDNSTNPNAVPCTTINSSVLYTACEMTQSSDVALNGNYTDAEDTNNSKEFAIKFLTESDPDITSDAQFNVYYEIKSTDPIFQNLDGTSTLSKTNCTTSVPKTKCAINIDAFGTTGNLPPGSYTVQAYIADTGSVWDPGNPKESNRVSWQVDVKELQTAGSISIGAQSAANATPIAANESWLENTGASCTSTNTVVNATNAITENDFITVHTLVKDRERDNFNLSMTISNGLGGGVTPIVGTTNIIRSNNSEFIEVINCFKVPEYVTSGAASSLATLNVSVTDVPDTVGLPAQFASQSLSLLVNNYNPNPTFSDNSDVNLNLLSSFAGLPFNLSAPTFNDLNTTDGNQISYKWQVSADNATWLDIPNANSTNQSNASLIWTAAPTLTGTVSFRLCLGDNGFGNPADCSQVTATKKYTNLNIISSQQSTAPSALISANDKRNLSSWLDKTNNNLYTTYSIGTNIYVNKKSTNTNGELVNEHTISFPLESDAQSPLSSSSQPANLSIDGIDGNTLMVAYNVLTTSPPIDKFFRVRRIDISYGKLSFKYGGFYNGELTDITPTAGYDQVSSITNSGLTITTTGSDNGEMNIQVTSVNNGDQFTITTPSGTAITLTVGNGIGELCQTTACPTPQNLAANIETFINNHANPEISKELLAVHVTSSDTVLIKGSNSYDFHDGISSMPYIGNISLKAGIGWAIPYVDTTTNSQLAIYRYTSATTNQNGTSPSFTKITTGSNLKSLKGLFSDSNYIVTAINNNNNMDIYKLTNAFAVGPLATINDAFNLGTFLVDEYDFDIGSDGTNQYIYVASKLKSNSSTDTKLAAIMSQMDLTSYVATDTFNITHNLTANIDEIKISASQVTKGNATLGIITSAANSSANNLHITKLTHPMNVGTYASSINFEISNDTNYNSPAVNASSIESTSTMSLTQSFTATRGYMSESSTPGTPDLSREVFYVNFMSTDPVTAGNTLLNLNMINTQKESVMSNSAAGLLSYPSFLKN